MLGAHALGCGDSRDKQFVAQVLQDKKVSLICTDPPYGVALVEGARGFKTLSKNKKQTICKAMRSTRPSCKSG